MQFRALYAEQIACSLARFFFDDTVDGTHSKCHVKCRRRFKTRVAAICVCVFVCSKPRTRRENRFRKIIGMILPFVFRFISERRADLHSTWYEFWFISPPVSLFCVHLLRSAQCFIWQNDSHDFWAYFDMVAARKSTYMLWATWHKPLHFIHTCISGGMCCLHCISTPIPTPITRASTIFAALRFSCARKAK